MENVQDDDNVGDDIPIPNEQRRLNNVEADDEQIDRLIQDFVNNDRVLDGGSAAPPEPENANNRLELLIEGAEDLEDLSPNNPMLRRGVTVKIGLNKSTKLKDVFSRYCEFINESGRSRSSVATGVDPSDLEFVHCAVLDGDDTAEASALMKTDRIRARRLRAGEREAAAEALRFQRESDRQYFRMLSQLVPDSSGKSGDVIFRCAEKVSDGNGSPQNVVTEDVRGHIAILRRRSRWLRVLIDAARKDLHSPPLSTSTRSEVEAPKSASVVPARVSIPAVPPADDFGVSGRLVRSDSFSPHEGDNNAGRLQRMCAEDDDDDDGIKGLQYPLDRSSETATALAHGNDSIADVKDSLPAQTTVPAVEDDEDDDDDDNNVASAFNARATLETETPSFPSSSSSAANADALVVNVPYPAGAVKILLEYCYTNRVLSLGQDAFLTASLGSVDGVTSQLAAVSPYASLHRGWPNDGHPTVSLSVALAAITLAEEAAIPRLSLMCEVAASHLVTQNSVLEALSVSTAQQARTGNPLALLRKAVMLEHVFGRRTDSVEDLYQMKSFQRSLEAKKDLVVPSLIMGVVEVLKATNSLPSPSSVAGMPGRGRKRHMSDATDFGAIDIEDTERREEERNKWRQRKRGKSGGSTRKERSKTKGRKADCALIGGDEYPVRAVPSRLPQLRFWIPGFPQDVDRLSHGDYGAR